MLLLLKRFLLIIIFISCLKMASAQLVRIDHVICVVKDIEKAMTEYEAKGFTIKKGYLHKNGLINAHIKFANNSSFELMSVIPPPKDALAKNYQALLNHGEGGVFIALTGTSSSAMQQRLSEAQIPHQVTKNKNWTYITFPGISGLSHFFFIEYHVSIKDDSEMLVHSNKAIGMKELFIDGNKVTISFLRTIGLNAKPGSNKFKTPTGNILVVENKHTDNHFRIRTIIFKNQNNKEEICLDF